MTGAGFTGPLFIIGMPRSGTKLLRDLLNRNPRIGIPTAETGFIPDMVGRFGNPPSFAEDVGELRRFYAEFSRTPFYWYMEEEGLALRWEGLESVEDRSSWPAIWEFIFRFYAPGEREDGFIWGDKTPGDRSVRRMPLLKDVFAEARFLHIIRDPRDVCLSTRKAWGKSLYRAANRWRTGVELARLHGSRMGPDYLEVHYESLLRDPQRVLQRICGFLECEYADAMTQLVRPAEDLGDAVGETRIVRDNVAKYRTSLRPSEVRRIEGITCPVAQDLGYSLEYDVKCRRPNAAMLRTLALYDAFATLRHQVKRHGIRTGLALFGRMSRSHVA